MFHFQSIYLSTYLRIAAPQSLGTLFNLSMETNIFPLEIAIEKVFPIFKAGDQSDEDNYRPISVIPSVGRVFERLIYEQMYAFLSESITVRI